MFEFRVHTNPVTIPVAENMGIMRKLLSTAPKKNDEDQEVINHVINESTSDTVNIAALEETQKQLLVCEPKRFEHIIADILLCSGFGAMRQLRKNYRQ